MPQNRFILTPDGEARLNYLCAGYRMFFRHIDPYMRAMAGELRDGRPASNVMYRLRAEQQRVLAAARAGGGVSAATIPAPAAPAGSSNAAA